MNHNGSGLETRQNATVAATAAAEYFLPSAPPPTYDEAVTWPNDSEPPQLVVESVESRLNAIIHKYEITEIFARKLTEKLNAFKIVYVFDDSGSMTTRLDESPLNHGSFQVSISYFFPIGVAQNWKYRSIKHCFLF